MPQSVVDDLVREDNGGTVPDSDEAGAGWKETITPGRFSDRTVIVTGATSGIGRAVAERIGREGGRVMAADISAERLEHLASSVPDARIEPEDAMWDRVIAINLTGGFKLSRAVIPRMLDVGAGAIVNIASEAGSARLSPFQAAIPTIAAAPELAASITFLLSEDAVNINGVVLPSDGGWSVQ